MIKFAIVNFNFTINSIINSINDCNDHEDIINNKILLFVVSINIIRCLNKSSFTDWKSYRDLIILKDLVKSLKIKIKFLYILSISVNLQSEL